MGVNLGRREHAVTFSAVHKIVFKQGEVYYLHYFTRKAPQTSRKYYGATFEEFEGGKLHFTSPRGNPIEFKPEQLINAL